jgi:hypothetical protein
MITSLSRSVLAVGAATAMLLSGCGGSGPHPTFVAEIQFKVEPQGGTPFTVQFLTDAAATHVFPDIPVFNSPGPVLFFIENATLPVGGTFCRAPGATGDITVTLLVTGQKTTLICATAGTDDAVTFSTGPGTPACMALPCNPTPVIPPNPASTEVRFDVCQVSEDISCAQATVVGGLLVVGPSFSASVGDPFTTRVSVGTSPSFYFLEGARDSVSGIFTSSSGFDLHAQLYINQAPIQSASGSGHVILKGEL